tara:strand:- start:930 stop:1148 length:219 start_codon:yes stop_codon:yes gene_type:complete
MKESKEPILSYNIDDKDYTLHEEDVTSAIAPLYDKLSATLRLQKTNEAFFNSIVDEKINALHHMVHNTKGEA